MMHILQLECNARILSNLRLMSRTMNWKEGRATSAGGNDGLPQHLLPIFGSLRICLTEKCKRRH